MRGQRNARKKKHSVFTVRFASFMVCSGISVGVTSLLLYRVARAIIGSALSSYQHPGGTAHATSKKHQSKAFKHPDSTTPKRHQSKKRSRNDNTSKRSTLISHWSDQGFESAESCTEWLDNDTFWDDDAYIDDAFYCDAIYAKTKARTTGTRNANQNSTIPDLNQGLYSPLNTRDEVLQNIEDIQTELYELRKLVQDPSCLLDNHNTRIQLKPNDFQTGLTLDANHNETSETNTTKTTKMAGIHIDESEQYETCSYLESVSNVKVHDFSPDSTCSTEGLVWDYHSDLAISVHEGFVAERPEMQCVFTDELQDILDCDMLFSGSLTDVHKGDDGLIGVHNGHDDQTYVHDRHDGLLDARHGHYICEDIS